ncbi:zinc finger MYM-type protein 1 [Caerostris extrusa]|uniref:Zinc finger MYM-type protein 1 n=1 Tax=Caerostris extrusa TaxID=172846 RepID=A0AAV4MXB0_CAEEX|nr:zinc finger MYM-type protein 1 [Caerostris extrusa]
MACVLSLKRPRFCFVCKLFPIIASSATALTSAGFNDWKSPAIIATHENSKNHRNAMLTVFAVICTFAERGLPFRGDNEKFGAPNNANYFGLLELEAKFDPFLRDHIDRYGNTGSGKPSYLSKIICEEIIQLMANKVKDTIMEEVKKTGYFSFSVDSTPDISHNDQLTLIIMCHLLKMVFAN